MPFSQQTIDFLFENRLHDSKAWFSEHKGDYTRFVVEPFAEIVNALAPTMAKIDPEIICDPKKLFSFYLNPGELRKLSDLTEGFLTTQLERGFSALDYYKALGFSREDAT